MATTEHEVLKIIGEKGKMGKTGIVSRLGISSGYADLVCKSLIREGYLRVIERRYYGLAPQGAKLLAGEGFKMVVDKSVLEEVARGVAKEVTQQINAMPVKERIVRGEKRTRELEEEEEGVKIKTSFISPMELEDVKMESNLEKISTAKKAKFDIGGAIKALKRRKFDEKESKGNEKEGEGN